MISTLAAGKKQRRLGLISAVESLLLREADLLATATGYETLTVTVSHPITENERVMLIAYIKMMDIPNIPFIRVEGTKSTDLFAML